MAIQALLFSKSYYNKNQVKNYLKMHNIIPIKDIHTTNKYYRCRLIEPNYKKYIYRKGNITTGIDCIFEFNK